MNPRISSDLFNRMSARVHDLWRRSEYFRKYLAEKATDETQLRSEFRHQLDRRVEQSLNELAPTYLKPSSRSYLKGALLQVLNINPCAGLRPDARETASV